MKKAFTHGGIFHADDVFSAALLTYLYPDIRIERGFSVPELYEGIVFDIGFGILWREYGEGILGKEQAEKYDESFVQPLDLADNIE